MLLAILSKEQALSEPREAVLISHVSLCSWPSLYPWDMSHSLGSRRETFKSWLLHLMESSIFAELIKGMKSTRIFLSLISPNTMLTIYLLPQSVLNSAPNWQQMKLIACPPKSLLIANQRRLIHLRKLLTFAFQLRYQIQWRKVSRRWDKYSKIVPLVNSLTICSSHRLHATSPLEWVLSTASLTFTWWAPSLSQSLGSVLSYSKYPSSEALASSGCSDNKRLSTICLWLKVKPGKLEKNKIRMLPNKN